MTDIRSRYRALFGSGESTERIVFFSDAVFAIAMTLLVLDIKVPEVDGGNLGRELLDLAPEYLAYALSFIIIALNWMAHHRKFGVITGYTTNLVRLNFVLLLLVAFVPFPTALLSEYGSEPSSVILYASVLGVIGLVQTSMWIYAHHAGLLDASVDEGVYRYVRGTGLVNPAVFALSILVALFIGPVAGTYSWLLIIPASLLADRIFTRK